MSVNERKDRKLGACFELKHPPASKAAKVPKRPTGRASGPHLTVLAWHRFLRSSVTSSSGLIMVIQNIAELFFL